MEGRQAEGRIIPTDFLGSKRCWVCWTENTEGRLFLDMMSHSPDEHDTTIWIIVEQHLHLDFQKSINAAKPRCLICKACWDSVYKFHVFYRMVHDNYTTEEHHPTEYVNVNVETDNPLANGSDNDDGKATTSLLSPGNWTIEDLSNESSPTANSSVATRGILNSEEKTRSSSEEATLCEETLGVDKEIIEFYGRMVCEICDRDRMARGVAAIEYSTLKELNNHLRIEHNVHAALRCPICANKYRTRVQLVKHKQMHLNPDAFRCDKCFEVHHNMKQHFKQRHAEKPYSCTDCGRTFALRSRLAMHLRVSHAARDVRCDQCNKHFSKYTIDDHKQAVHRTIYICEHCPRTFKSLFWLNRHKEQHNVPSSNIRAVTCTICNATVKDKYILASHMRRTHSDKPAVGCTSCGKSFKSKHHLNKHLRNVCTDRSFPCAACGKQFKQKVKLNEHMTTHTGMSLYVCNFCPQKFKYESRFYEHHKKEHREQWLEMQKPRQKGPQPKLQRIEHTRVEQKSNL